jgi:hypothetical protein
VAGTDAPAALVGAGYAPSHEAVRDGLVACVAGRGGHTVRVTVCSLLRVVARAGLGGGGQAGVAAPASIPGLPADAAALPAAAGLVLVEAAAVGGEVDYPAAAAAVAAVADALRPHIQLAKE